MPRRRAPNVVPSNKNGSSDTGSILPVVMRSVPNPAMRSRKVAGLVARSMTVFLPVKGRCQSFRKAMYSSSLARNPDAAAPPNTLITGWPSRYAPASPFMRSAHCTACAVLAPDCTSITAIVTM